MRKQGVISPKAGWMQVVTKMAIPLCFLLIWITAAMTAGSTAWASPAARQSRGSCTEQAAGSVGLCHSCETRPCQETASSSMERSSKALTVLCGAGTGLGHGCVITWTLLTARRGIQPVFSLHPCKGLQTNHHLLLLLIEVGKPFCFPSRTIWSLTVLPELIFYFFSFLSFICRLGNVSGEEDSLISNVRGGFYSSFLSELCFSPVPTPAPWGWPGKQPARQSSNMKPIPVWPVRTFHSLCQARS